MKQVTTLVALLAGLAFATACGGDDAPAAPDAPAQNGSAAPEATATAPETSGSGEQAAAEDAEAASEAGSAQFASFPEPYASADYNHGKRIFKQCQTCHTLNEGGPTVMGPNLYGLFGREVGSWDGFEYSDALQEADFEWTPDKLDQWLTSPRAFLPGNNMSFSGVRRPNDRAAVIAYVMAETGYDPS